MSKKVQKIFTYIIVGMMLVSLVGTAISFGF